MYLLLWMTVICLKLLEARHGRWPAVYPRTDIVTPYVTGFLFHSRSKSVTMLYSQLLLYICKRKNLLKWAPYCLRIIRFREATIQSFLFYLYASEVVPYKFICDVITARMYATEFFNNKYKRSTKKFISLPFQHIRYFQLVYAISKVFVIREISYCTCLYCVI